MSARHVLLLFLGHSEDNEKQKRIKHSLDLKTQSIQLEYIMHKQFQTPQVNFSSNKITAKGTPCTLTIKSSSSSN
jgi:hypothetical protein